MVQELTSSMGSKPESVIVVRALMLGDMLCSVPTLRALRAAWPQARITLCGLPWAAEWSTYFAHYIDAFCEFPGFPGLPERTVTPKDVAQFLLQAQREQYDLAIQLHGSGSHINEFMALLGARRVVGFCDELGYSAAPESHTVFAQQGHEIHRLLALCETLRIPRAGDHLEFPVDEKSRIEARNLCQELSLSPGKYVCMHVGSRWESRRWLPDRFAAIADSLAGRGWSVVFTGSMAEQSLIDQVRRRMAQPSISVAGRTNLGTLAEVVRGAAWMLTNDTGLSHLAVAVGTPSLVLVLGSDPDRWAPLNAEQHPHLSVPVPCRPCSYVTCPIGFDCAMQLRATDVLSAALKMLTPASVSKHMASGSQPMSLGEVQVKC